MDISKMVQYPFGPLPHSMTAFSRASDAAVSISDTNELLTPGRPATLFRSTHMSPTVAIGVCRGRVVSCGEESEEA
jgi:hypothetical protein